MIVRISYSETRLSFALRCPRIVENVFTSERLSDSCFVLSDSEHTAVVEPMDVLCSARCCCRPEGPIAIGVEVDTSPSVYHNDPLRLLALVLCLLLAVHVCRPSEYVAAGRDRLWQSHPRSQRKGMP